MMRYRPTAGAPNSSKANFFSLYLVTFTSHGCLLSPLHFYDADSTI